MMMPSLSTTSSSASVTTRVDKATSELLVAPDWTMNIEICDICNSNHWLAKDVVKAVKRRLQHKSPKVQLLALTLLETMVKNCGEYIHYHIAERKIVDEMIKIVKKKTDIHVRDKILALLDSWQEAFGGPSGKYTQYYWACDELRHSGIQFPQRSQHSAPVITPPVTQSPAVAQVGFGMPSNSLRRLDEAMTSEVEGLSASILKSMENVLEVLDDMLQAVNPDDRMAVKDEVIVDLVDRCRANQKKLLQMITNTTDEELLVKGIEMNDSLQLLLAKHDAIALGAPLSKNGNSASVQTHGSSNTRLETSEAREKNPAQDAKPSASAASVTGNQGEEEEEDEFAQLARRHSKAQSIPSQSDAAGATEDSASSSGCNALVLVDLPAPEPAPTNTTKEQDLIDLLSLALTTTSTSSETPQAPNPALAETASQASLNSYVAPWAQPQTQPQAQPQTQYQTMQPQVQHGYSQYSSIYPPPPWEATSSYSNNQYPASNPYVHPVSQGNMNGSISMQGTSPAQNINTFQNAQYGNPLYSNGQSAVISSSPMQGAQPLQRTSSFQDPAVNGNLYSTSQSTIPPPSTPVQGAPSLQHVNSFPAKTINGLVAMNGALPVTSGSGSIPSGKKPFVPSYRLFEDLNVFGGSEGKLKSGPYPSASENPNQNMLAGRR